MDSLPPELHSLILEIVCASPFGGQTIRVMSLTNTYFQAISAPFLFYTLSVSSQDQATHLIKLLEATPVPKRHIRRLFLGPALGLPPASALRLLHFAAPTLRDLTVVLPPSSSALLGAVFRTPMPYLRALAVRGFYPLPRPGAFPALTHLHLAGNHSPAGLPVAVASACPALTHLRVSSLRGAPAFARQLRDLLQVDAVDAERIGVGPRWEHMECITLEAQPAVQSAKTNRVAEVRDVEMRQVLSGLKKDAEKREDGPSVEFLEGDSGSVYAMKMAWLGMVCP
ncbi:hypothetical protein B0H19DRAFT_997227 [Mycena capillaripes]|nr:hypothetical protein B0H19DRAFT_997227 [Mycena capillaripes]